MPRLMAIIMNSELADNDFRRDSMGAGKTGVVAILPEVTVTVAVAPAAVVAGEATVMTATESVVGDSEDSSATDVVAEL